MGLDNKMNWIGDSPEKPYSHNQIVNDFPGQIIPAGNGGNILITNMDKVINWGRSNSLWPLYFGTSCCAIEMMQTGAARQRLVSIPVLNVARPTPDKQI